MCLPWGGGENRLGSSGDEAGGRGGEGGGMGVYRSLIYAVFDVHVADEVAPLYLRRVYRSQSQT